MRIRRPLIVTKQMKGSIKNELLRHSHKRGRMPRLKMVLGLLVMGLLTVIITPQARTGPTASNSDKTCPPPCPQTP
jgi:hypothetical protein